MVFSDECGRVLKMNIVNFSRNKKARSGFYSRCNMRVKMSVFWFVWVRLTHLQ